MQTSLTHSCPFVAGPMITDPHLFVGRKNELRILAGRMSGAQPTSLNVVGERRMGKSSLLYHFFQTWEHRVSSPNRFVVVYLDLQAKTPSSEAAFFQALGRALARQQTIQRVEPLRRTLLAPPRTSQGFVDLLEQCTNHVLLPVFCLDEFEVLLKNSEQFTDCFFDQLRGCMNAGHLMFILSSRRPLDVYAGEQNLTSAFFNLGHVVELGEFSEEEADELVCLPVDGEPALDAEERQLARQWGGRHPYLLQLAGLSLWEARQAGKSTRRAKGEFERQRRRFVTKRAKRASSGKSYLSAAFWDFPCWLGGKPIWLGGLLSDIGKWLTGTIIIGLFIGLLFDLKEAGVVYTLLLNAFNYFKQVL
ncbi:AAA-like domain-containing protein [Candidatus Electrothrix sp.]|uniref:AAA-like domain-containing protein n=1 Tax=Candidatus Electrothrix sp. TaxID=2170559 RepID=UPI004056D236